MNPSPVLQRLAQSPHTQSFVSTLQASDGGLISTAIHELEIQPRVPHPRREEFIRSRMAPWTPYDSAIPVVDHLEVLRAFVEANALDKLPTFKLATQREFYRLKFAPLRVGIVAAGGLAPGMNTVIDGIVKRHGALATLSGTQECKGVVGNLIILGFAGYPALINREGFELTHKLTDPVAREGGCFFGMARGAKDPRFAELAAESVEKLRLDILYVIGGDGTQRAADLLQSELLHRGIRGAQGQLTRVVGAPKTMDNDVYYTDRTFGYDTAVTEAVQMTLRVHTEAEAARKIAVVEFFGAESGYIALDAMVLGGEADDVLVPEEITDTLSRKRILERLAQRLAERYLRKRHAVLIVAEGAAARFRRRTVDGFQIFCRELHKRIAEILRLPLNAVPWLESRPRHLIRTVPPVASDLRLCKYSGKLMVDTALAGFSGCVVSLWHGRMCLVPMHLAARGKRQVALDKDFGAMSMMKRDLP